MSLRLSLMSGPLLVYMWLGRKASTLVTNAICCAHTNASFSWVYWENQGFAGRHLHCCQTACELRGSYSSSFGDTSPLAAVLAFWLVCDYGLTVSWVFPNWMTKSCNKAETKWTKCIVSFFSRFTDICGVTFVIGRLQMKGPAAHVPFSLGLNVIICKNGSDVQSSCISDVWDGKFWQRERHTYCLSMVLVNYWWHQAA